MLSYKLKKHMLKNNQTPGKEGEMWTQQRNERRGDVRMVFYAFGGFSGKDDRLPFLLYCLLFCTLHDNQVP
jgi:hypothetical protein